MKNADSRGIATLSIQETQATSVAATANETMTPVISRDISGTGRG
jgi:hypothetical protein